MAPVQRKSTIERRKSIVEPKKLVEKTTEPLLKRDLQRRKSIAVEPVRKTVDQRRKSIVVEPPKRDRRKSIVEPKPERRKSVVEPKPERRKSVVVEPKPELRKSIVAEKPPPMQRRKSVAAPASVPPSTKKSVTPVKRPTSLQQSELKRAQESMRASQQQQQAELKRVQESIQRTQDSRRPFKSNSILKSRTPITAPSTPDLHESEDEEEFDMMCNDNTLANSAPHIASPVSIEKEKEEESEDDLEESEEEDDDDALDDDEQMGESTEEESTVLGEEEVIKHEPKPVYGTLASAKPTSKSDQMVPLKDYEELRFKLKILENKRHEDRDKFREHEKIKEEAEQFLTLRNKLQDKISELQKDVRDARRDLKQVTNEKETFESKYTEIADSLEMMTLDKEVAEERADSLQQETNILKDRIAEISIDLDILKKEADSINRPPQSENGEERTPMEVIQLERHNERLKEALLRLRDATTEQEAELNLRIKILEQENYELEDIQYQYEKAKEQLDSAELLIEELKIQLDDAMGTEDLVEQLTEKNLNLTEKNDEIQATLDDLEALKELADELEENHVETERQLQAEIDHRDMLLREQVERLKANEETMMDYETTIEQFRELVNHLQNDLQDLKRKEKDDQSEKKSLSSQSQAMMSLNMQLQTTVMKAQAKSIDLELRKLEAAQANDRLTMIQPYLPESFFNTENDPISCYLLFRRLEFKSELIIKHLDQNYPVSEKIMDNVTESLITICELKQRAGWLSSLSVRFQTHIKNCEPDIFTQMGKVYQDLVSVERKMNGIVEQFRSDQLNESYCLVEIQRVISQVEHLVESNLHQEKNSADQFFGLTKSLDLNADRMIVIFTFARQLLDNSVIRDGLQVDEGLGQMEQDYMEPLGRLITQAKNSKIITKKLIRQLEDKFEEAMTLKGEHLNRFKMLYSISTKLCQFCFDIYRSLVAYIDTRRGSHKELELSHIRIMLREKGDEIFEMSESSMWESALRTLKSLTNELETTHAQVESDEKLDKITTKVAPWIQRASDIKAEVVINHELEHKLQQHNEEIIKLIKDVRSKEQSLQEADVKIDLFEKRMNVAKKEIERIKSLEDELKKSVNNAKACTEHMENMQNENDLLESEINKLKKEANRREEKKQSMLRKANFDLANEDSTTMQEMAGNYYEMSGQMETLKMSVRYLRSENAHLKSLDFTRSLDLDFSHRNEPLVKDDHYKSVARETRVLMKDLRKAGACPRVVHLSDKKSMDYQYQTQQSVLYTLKQRSVQLRNQINDLQITTKIDNKESSLPSQPTKMLGLIKIPNLLSLQDTSRHCIHLKSTTEFERLHNVFIQP